MIDLLLRICDNVDCFSGGARITPGNRATLLKRSFISLCSTISHNQHSPNKEPARLVLIDDGCADETLAWLNEHFRLHCDKLDVELIHVPVVGKGNGDSIKTHYDWARANSSDLIYFLEDDYLHEYNMLEKMLEFYKICTKERQMEEVVLHPCDYPDRYNELYPSWIILGGDRHWRTIQHTTTTSMIARKTLDNYWDLYEAYTQYGKAPDISEDSTINKIYQTVPCFSPMPTLSTHVQYESTISPFIDWSTLWTANAR
jgi:hypothetical protein